MDDKGFIFTLDAVLALIPIFIVLATVAHLSDDNLMFQSQEIRISHDAQDTLEAMANYKAGISQTTVLQNVTESLMANNKAAAANAAQSYFNKTLGNANYNFTEINQINTTIIAKGNMANATNTAVGVRSYGNYTFKLYIWD